MKLLNKLVITFFITILVTVCSYFFMPIKLEAAFNMLIENPEYIVVTEKKNDSEFNSYKIEDENDIANIYDDIKEIKIVKSFKNPVISNEYNIYMGDQYISLSLSEEFIKVNDETFRIIDSGDKYKELLREIKENFIK
ncbi:hypothetical protein C0L85_13305 [Clostridium perfringens]|uniref:hypothetical protein n=1 Tax=Clostridium perfringens TaxID=1502 RepID=UPI000D99FFFC|nr:hypothetical protein [Clostridium perfringens]UBK59723.1 hypothetical protein KLF23_07775 [Clostridium perfringens]SQB24617.1 Uncharacterised protein [Clostridium perfringens]